jgi:DNA-binding CsgD family transcriptional regulator
MTALTLRESEVMDLLADGLSREQIAQRLGISPRTVNLYLALAREKYDDAPSTLVAAVRHERQRWQSSV